MASRGRPRRDLTNQTYHNWTVVGPDEFRGPRRRVWWCRCSCGFERWIDQCNLLAGRPPRCKQCNLAATNEKKHKPKLTEDIWLGLGSLCVFLEEAHQDPECWLWQEISKEHEAQIDAAIAFVDQLTWWYGNLHGLYG